jgi:phosphonate transport system permease protein
MTSSISKTFNPPNPILAGLLSLIVPGAGQFYAGKRGRAVAILLALIAQVYLIYWAFDNFQVGQLIIGGIQISWLLILLALFWIWNVVDAFRLVQGERAPDLIGVLVPLLVVYIIAYQVTDVRLDRLVTRFDNLLKIGSDIFHPDLLTQDAAGAWMPSENFGYIFGSIGPEVMGQLGPIVIPVFHAGKIVETIALGLISTIFSTILAIPLSFLAAHNIMLRVPGGTVIYYVMRTMLNVVRAIDTLIWGLIVVLWVGLGSFAGVLALTIHSIAALAKLFSEEVEHIDPGPIEAITATGANMLQTIRYAVVPQIIPSFLAYTLLRWDINMRSATIVGFVAGGGIGFFVVETIRKGGYTQYAAALWAVAIVVMIVDYVSAKWRERILVGDTKIRLEKPKPFYKSLRAWFYIVVGAWAFVYAWQLCDINLKELFDPAPTLGRFINGFVSLNLSPEVVSTVVNQMTATLFQALLATTLGALLAIPFSFLAARNLTGRSSLSIWIYYLTRFMFNLLRSIEALMYVSIFFFWVGFGNYPGMLALAVTTFGLIGKLFSEAIENIDPGPLEAITATGATRFQAIAYGILPQIVPPFVSYSIYQWDINVRMATVVGFAGGGGIGNLLANVYFPFSSYRSAGTAVAAIVIVVAVMDFASAKIREQMV